ncbi:hypothetical protein [Allonocardiopsis opalescens]|uniref:Secreted protein n=1 Tax=Allonocardiopsis opalescens TaxID=1144618 RepID=A0A2T0QES1_9ACTN|nr:hypothetical protein [Allonocardiopsis opalescens]PRY02436.1 hypothetical protein CLV72_1011038 [Allonocardiopsis opalescens]
MRTRTWARAVAAAAVAAGLAAGAGAPAHADARYDCAGLLSYDEGTGKLIAYRCEGEGTGPGIVSVADRHFYCGDIGPGPVPVRDSIEGTGCWPVSLLPAG